MRILRAIILTFSVLALSVSAGSNGYKNLSSHPRADRPSSEQDTTQRPQLYVQQGPEYMSALAVSPDGKLIAAVSGTGRNNAIQFYDLATQRQLRTLTHNDTTAIAFSPDGKLLASVGHEEEHASSTLGYAIRLWDVATGRLEDTIEIKEVLVRNLVFTPDGTGILLGNYAGIAIYDVERRTVPRRFGGDRFGGYLALSSDGTTVASEADGVIQIWDLTTGAQKATLKGFKGDIRVMRFNADGRYLVSAARDSVIRWWDLAQKKQLKSYPNPTVVEDVRFDPDGQHLLSISTTGVRQWDLKTGTGRDLFALPAIDSASHALEGGGFTPDGSRVVAVSFGNITVWDIAAVRPVAVFPRRSRAVSEVRLVEESGTQKLVAASGDISYVWDYRAGRYLGSLTTNPYCPESKCYISPDKKLRVTVKAPTVTVADATSGAILREINTGQKAILSFAVTFSPDSKLLALPDEDSTTKVVDLTSGTVVSTINHRVNRAARLVPDNFPWKMAFSADMKILAGSVTDNQDGEPTVTLWETATGKELRVMRYLHEMASAIAFSPDGAWVAAGDRGGHIMLWDVPTGNHMVLLPPHAEPGHEGQIEAVTFAPNDILITGGDDGKVKLWDLKGIGELVSLVSIDGADWLAVTPAGLFDGSPGGWSTVLWRFSPELRDVAPVESFFSEYYYPNLLPDILAGKRPVPPAEIGEKDRRQPQLNLSTVTASGPETAGATRHQRVRIDLAEAPGDAAHSAGSGLRDVRLFRNGSLIKVWHGDIALQNGRAALEADVTLVAGENRLTAYAFNRDNVKSADASLSVLGPPQLRRKGVEYILTVGINEYANSGYNLKYAVADARDFANEVRARQEGLGQYERVETVALYDRDATKEKLLAVSRELAAEVQPEDAVIIYFAGHGIAAGNRFYLVPHDLGYSGARDKLDQPGLNAILAHSISDEELQAAVEGIDAGQMLMVVDACNSGQALEAEEKRRGPMNSKGLAQLAYEKGMYILTAAQSYQAALEASKLGHGYLTYALVEEGLKTAAADTDPKDGNVLLREWLDYATARVPALQQEKLRPTAGSPPPATPEGQRLLLQQTVTFTNGEENLDPARRTLQRPRVFYRREPETQPAIMVRF